MNNKNIVKKIKPTLTFSGLVLKYYLTMSLFILLPLVAFTLTASKSPILLGIRSFVVVTGSMSPTYPVGSLIFTEKKATYNVGEIIAFKNAANLTVTHRIVSKVTHDGQNLYQTQGDANNAPDANLVKESDIVGQSFFGLAKVGLFMGFLKTMPGFLSLIIAPTILFIILELWAIKKEIEKSVEERIMKKMRELHGIDTRLNQSV